MEYEADEDAVASNPEDESQEPSFKDEVKSALSEKPRPPKRPGTATLIMAAMGPQAKGSKKKAM
jgi:hypothetical protein